MGRNPHAGLKIEPVHVERYLRAHGHPDAELTGLHPLGEQSVSDLKSYGYGRPLQACFTAGGQQHTVVIRTMSPDPFGHGRRSDRVGNMVLCFDTFGDIPGHIHPLDVGAFDTAGDLVSYPRGEPFLVTDFVEGTLYAQDMESMRSRPAAEPRDLTRAETLATYLATLHAERRSTEDYVRHLRDTLGSGEGIFGLCDAHAAQPDAADSARLEAIEIACVRWRWKMREHAARACRTHGDFHPFNILLPDDHHVAVLDCSRGAAGEAADDVVCLAINYLFFALTTHNAFVGACREVWTRFWHTYLRASGDAAVLEFVAPYFAWRALVLASPLWYPSVSPDNRNTLLAAAERLLQGAPFHPDRVDELLA